MNDLFYGSVTLGERGQIVIPAEARKHHQLAPGDKLLVFRHPHMHGMVLARLDDMQALLKEMQQWLEMLAEVQHSHALADGRAARKRSKKGGHGK
jgi:AbrB family looped-hinge helix DNA binding protein